MSAAESAPTPAPAPVAEGALAPPPGARGGFLAHGPAEEPSVLRGRPTPDALGRIAAVVAAVLVVTALVANLATAAFQRAAVTARDNTGPVLVATQSLLASLAEADAAATAALLGGGGVDGDVAAGEDPVARRTYLDALERATAQVEQVSRLIGDDDLAHDALADLGAAITRYAGLVDAARATDLVGLDAEAEGYLLDAVALLEGDVREATGRLEAATSQRLADDTARLEDGLGLGRWALLASLAVLVLAQADLARRTRRILNPALLAATALVLGLTVWSLLAVEGAGNDVRRATSDGFRAIEASAQVQASAFEAKGAETVVLLTGSTAARQRADEAIARTADFRGLPTDSDRESARLLEADVRWARYLEAVQDLRLARAREQQVAIVAGPLSQAFNGFVFQMEGVLADNRDQFLAGLGDAAGRTSGLPVGALVLPLLAAVLVAVGYQQRIGEYR